MSLMILKPTSKKPKTYEVLYDLLNDTTRPSPLCGHHIMYESRGGFTVSNGHPLTQAEGHTQRPRHFPPLLSRSGPFQSIHYQL